MFVDDLLLSGEATEQQMVCVMNILQIFCVMSGQEVSTEQTRVYFSNNVARGVRSQLISLY